ncbi:MAG: prokaryotic cytochrome C oxidase subunit IV family protein [Denitromonas halophila]|nr:MAG: prokaryotic cytochrome C oxidase subunit IV family protein [Denitromonas halophila]TVT75717.1 MAG: prokaryotic cytochrome C oxidase subunit IV family protein [Denitromonas halophila]
MKRFEERKLGVAWLTLVVVTVTGFTIAEAVFIKPLSVALVMALSGVKARLVLYRFMELNEAPTGLRVFFNAWLLICVLMIFGFYSVA